MFYHWFEMAEDATQSENSDYYALSVARYLGCMLYNTQKVYH